MVNLRPPQHLPTVSNFGIGRRVGSCGGKSESWLCKFVKSGKKKLNIFDLGDCHFDSKTPFLVIFSLIPKPTYNAVSVVLSSSHASAYGDSNSPAAQKSSHNSQKDNKTVYPRCVVSCAAVNG